MRVLIIDNYDSFTYNIYNAVCIIFKRLKQPYKDVLVIKNDERGLSEVIDRCPTHIILGPGQGSVYNISDIGIAQNILHHFCTNTKILGICLGHQLICKYFGGTIVYATEIMHGRIDMIDIDTADILFEKLNPRIAVMRYHSQIAIDLPDTLKPLGFSTKQYCMAVRHTKYTIWGVQFHPESFATIDGNRIFTNFLIA